MATKAFYAWTDLTVPNSAVEGAWIKIPVGDEVTESKVGKDWDDFVAAGVIRRTPYPEGVQQGESPRVALLRQANEAAEKANEPFIHELEPDE